MNKKWSAEVDRRRVDIDAERRYELRESNELSRHEKVEAKQKDEASKSVRKQLDDDLKIQISAEVDRRRVEIDAKIRSEVHESNELSHHEKLKQSRKMRQLKLLERN